MRFTRIIIIMVLIAGSCVTPYNEDIPVPEKKMVMYGFIQPDSTIEIRLWQSFSQFHDPCLSGDTCDGYEAKNKKRIENATATLIENGKLIEKAKKNYVGRDSIRRYAWPEFQPKAGSIYKIEASAPGFQSISATVTIPEKKIAFNNIDTMVVMDGFSRELRIEAQFTDPEGTQYYYPYASWNYGRFVGNQNEPPKFDWINIKLEHVPSAEIMVQSDKNFKKNPVVFKGNIWNINQITECCPDGIYLHLANISYSFYQYFLTLQQYEARNSGFFEPVQVYSNVKNGHGVLAAFNPSRDSLKINKAPFERDFGPPVNDD